MVLSFTFSQMEKQEVRERFFQKEKPKIKRVGENNQNNNSYFLLSAYNVPGTVKFFIISLNLPNKP